MPVFFAFWAYIGTSVADPLVMSVLRGTGESTAWVLAIIAFALPVAIAVLLHLGYPLEHFPVLGAVLILGGIGILLALLVTGLATLSRDSFTGLFLCATLLLAYAVALLLARKVKPARHVHPTEPLPRPHRHHH